MDHFYLIGSQDSGAPAEVKGHLLDFLNFGDYIVKKTFLLRASLWNCATTIAAHDCGYASGVG